MPTFVDVNPSSRSLKGLLLYDKDAVVASLRNLFRCPIGNRGRIFQPEYGSGLYELLQEPVDPTTAATVRANLIDAIRKWEPRIDTQNINVQPNYRLPGYEVSVLYRVRGFSELQRAAFDVQQ